VYFPTYSLTNFYERPEKIVEFANTCKYRKSSNGRWPGVRSECLSVTNHQLFRYSCEKILKMIFGKEDVSYFAINEFQIITNEDINNSKFGWAHKDPVMLTAIIYLSENNSSGTKILSNPFEGYLSKDIRETHKYDNGDLEKEKESNNNQYTDFVHHNSLYNSLLAFQGSHPHKALFDIKDQSARLTQIIFFKQINAPWFPIPEMNTRA